jgi:5-methyltetrahydropteroyltriglutamate--homocysteine methyltransferase
MARKVYRADHCGSLLRPDSLKKARADFVHGRISRQQLDDAESKAILAVLDLQKQVGLDVYSDGEFRRGFWLSALSDEFFEGFENEGIDYIRYPFLKGKEVADAELLVPPNPIVKGKLALKKRITGRETEFLKEHAPGPFKITIPSPITLSRASYKKGVSERAYPTWKEFFDDYARLTEQEIRAIAADGVPYIQIDAPHYTRFMIPERRNQLTDLGVDLEEEFNNVVAAENRCLRAARGNGATVALHICLGTFILGPQGPMGGAGSYDESIVGRLISELDADVFLVEYSERTGSLETLRAVPKNKVISLGIVNIRDPRVETADEIKRKLDTAAKYVPMENLSLCPNCGFSGGAIDAFVSEDIEKRKLTVMAEVAHQVWG